MITIEEAKELGFISEYSYFIYPLGRMELFLCDYELCLLAETECADVSHNLSHLTLEQVKQLITLLKP